MTRKAKKGKKGKGEGAMGWLAVAALALIVLAGCCATADVALLRVSRAGAKELGRRTAAEGSSPLQAVLAEVPRYLSVLSLARVAGEAGATVLLTVVLLHVIGPGWRAFAGAAACWLTSAGCGGARGSRGAGPVPEADAIGGRVRDGRVRDGRALEAARER